MGRMWRVNEDPPGPPPEPDPGRWGPARVVPVEADDDEGQVRSWPPGPEGVPVLEAAPSPTVLQYVVYRYPSDYPHKWVVRAWSIKPGRYYAGPVVAVEDQLDVARLAIPDGLVNVGRYGEDDPVVYEVWT